MAKAQADRTGRRALLGLAVVSLAATLPIVLTDTGRASARSLVVAQQRAGVLDALRTPDLRAVHAADPSGDDARLAVDGRDDTAWTGRPGEQQWRWAASFARPVHLGLVRATLGASPTSGVPTVFHWEARPPAKGATTAITTTRARPRPIRLHQMIRRSPGSSRRSQDRSF